MTDHIIKAAKEAGITASIGQTVNGKYRPNVNALGKTVPVEWLARFYALAFAAGMERAAEICEAEQDRSEEARADARFRAALKDGDERNAVDRGTHWMAVHTTNAVLRNAAKAIRAEAHTQNQPKTTHDTGNVSKN